MLKEINIDQLNVNPFTLIDKEWALITAGDKEQFNTMTASWGHMGVIWNKNVITVYVRPQRYTNDFMQQFDHFTVSFYPEKYKDALMYCGRHSGRDVNKVKETNLTPIHENDVTYFEESKLVFVCKKIYEDRIQPENFLTDEIQNNYPKHDYHIVYMGEVEKVYQSK